MQADAEVTAHMQAVAPALRGPLAQALAAGHRMVAQGEPMREVLTHLAGTVETLGPGTTASILVLDGEGLLRNGASPNLAADYLDAIDRLKPNPDLGTCAAAAATGEIVLTPDFCADARWAELRHLPMALGFLGAWSMPIKTPAGRILGTFGTYFRERREPTGQEREIVGLLMPLAAAAISARAT
jgi:GAF domain-containing protein